jgi:hypothetical protein
MTNFNMCAMDSVAATIANGTSLSGNLNLGGLRLFGIVMPSAWTSASLTFLMSPDGGTTWVSMFDINGNELTATVAASHFVALDPTLFASVQMLQIRSGTSGAPVAQGANRQLTLVLRAV